LVAAKDNELNKEILHNILKNGDSKNAWLCLTEILINLLNSRFGFIIYENATHLETGDLPDNIQELENIVKKYTSNKLRIYDFYFNDVSYPTDLKNAGIFSLAIFPISIKSLKATLFVCNSKLPIGKENLKVAYSGDKVEFAKNFVDSLGIFPEMASIPLAKASSEPSSFRHL